MAPRATRPACARRQDLRGSHHKRIVRPERAAPIRLDAHTKRPSRCIAKTSFILPHRYAVWSQRPQLHQFLVKHLLVRRGRRRAQPLHQPFTGQPSAAVARRRRRRVPPPAAPATPTIAAPTPATRAKATTKRTQPKPATTRPASPSAARTARHAQQPLWHAATAATATTRCAHVRPPRPRLPHGPTRLRAIPSSRPQSGRRRCRRRSQLAQRVTAFAKLWLAGHKQRRRPTPPILLGILVVVTIRSATLHRTTAPLQPRPPPPPSPTAAAAAVRLAANAQSAAHFNGRTRTAADGFLLAAIASACRNH